jgi:hypothetical protein
MKHLLIKSVGITCLLFVIGLAACNGGRPATNGGPPANASSSPPPIANSGDVVKVSAAGVSIQAGGKVDANVVLSISSGFHVNANPATFPYLIATEVTPGKVEGINVDSPGYPGAEKKKFQFADQPLAVYEGEVQVKLSLRAEKNAASGSRSLPIAVRVQACDDEKCFPPATVNTTISVEVK